MPEATPLAPVVRDARSIVVVALAEVGDMVLLSAFLHELRHLARGARLTLVCLPEGAHLYECSDDVDDVIVYDARMPRLLRPILLPRRARLFARSRLRGRFDLAVVPRWDTDHHLAAAVALFSEAPRRVGHTERSNERKRVLNAGFDRLFTDVVTSSGVAHEVERHLAMLRALGADHPSSELRLALTDEDRRVAADALGPVREGARLVAFGIGAAHPKRRWEIARFAELARALQRDHEARVVVVGGPADVAAQAELLRALGSDGTGLAGRLTLRQSGAVLERCRLFVGSDSAPMHLAAAVGTPCVEISCHPLSGDPLHSNAPERFAPWRVASRVVRPRVAVPPCRESCTAARPHCILAITPAMVVEAVESLLRQLGAVPVGVNR
jgi:heptosyltransferase-2